MTPDLKLLIDHGAYFSSNKKGTQAGVLQCEQDVVANEYCTYAKLFEQDNCNFLTYMYQFREEIKSLKQ